MKRIVNFLTIVFLSLVSNYSFASDNYVESNKVNTDEVMFSAKGNVPACSSISSSGPVLVNMTAYFYAYFDGVLPSDAVVRWVVTPNDGVYFADDTNTGNSKGIRFTNSRTYQVSAFASSPTKGSGMPYYVYMDVR